MGRGPSVEYHKEMMDGYIKGTLTCLTAEYIKSKITMDFPLILNIEPTNTCNLNCYLCSRNLGVRELGFMDFQLYQRIINECKLHKKLKMINFHKDGESLLHPKIYEMIKYAAKMGVAETLHINTNGLLLNEENSREFLLCGINDVTVSIDAARQETFKKIKKANLLKKVELNTKRLLKLRKEMGLIKPFIRVKIMEFEDTSKSEINEFISRWQGVADDVQVTGVHNWGGAIKDLKVTDEAKEIRYPCVLLWYMMAINWDGKVSACNVDWNLSAVIGDVSKETIHQIWNGQKIKELRKAELSGNHKIAQVCENCIVWCAGEDLTDWFMRHKEFYA